MRIVQLCPYAMDRPGGVQRHVSDLSAWLTAQGHETRIVAPPLPGRGPTRRGPLYEVGKSKSLGVHGTGFEISLALPWSIKKLATDLKTWGADLVHMHTPWTPRVVGQMHHALNLPTVTTIHATLPQEDGASLIDRYIRFSARTYLRQSQAIVTPSPAPLGMLGKLVAGLDPNILPPCVDLSGFAPAPKIPDSLLFLGRLEPRKGLDVLLQAWPRIAAAHSQARLTIAGDGPMRNLAQTQPGIDFVGRPDDAALKRLMSKADLFIAPAPYGESYGLVIAEAMASGAIPIAANNPGYAHILETLPELLVPAGDPDALADRAISVLRTDRQRLRNRVVAQATLSDVATVGPKYLNVFERVLAHSRLQ